MGLVSAIVCFALLPCDMAEAIGACINGVDVASERFFSKSVLGMEKENRHGLIIKSSF